MSHSSIPAIIQQHFDFENPELIDRVTETFGDNIIWEAPARHLYLTDQHAIVNEYHHIIAGIKNPKTEALRSFTHNDEVFDDRLVYFTANPNNVWGIPANKQVKLRLAHYFKICHDKIIHEIGYEMWSIE